MGEMRDSDWSRRNLLRSDWSGPRVAIYTTKVSKDGAIQNEGQINFVFVLRWT